MAQKDERVEISVAVRLTGDCDDAEVLAKAANAILDAQSHLMEIPGAKRLTGGYTIGPLVQRIHRLRRVARHRLRRAARRPRHTVHRANDQEPDTTD
jgi:hypothetical protein